MMIPFDEAKAYRLTFGAFKGQTLAEMATTERGRSWLVWACANLRLDFHTGNAIESFLRHEKAKA